MPSVLIEVRRPHTPAQAGALIAAVHGALKEAFQLPETDRNVRLVAHDPVFFQCPPPLSQPERFTQVTVDAIAGRSLDAKRKFYQLTVEALEKLGTPRDHSTIIVRDSPAESWGLRGGQAACDVDLGFRIDV